MILLKSDANSTLRGKYSGCVYKSGRYGLHIQPYTKTVKKYPTNTQKRRRIAFRKLLTFLRYNTDTELVNLWSNYGNKQLQWNQKFIQFNINRLLDGWPIWRFPPCHNMIINGDFSEGSAYWSTANNWLIHDYRAYSYTSIPNVLIHDSDIYFEKGKKYRYSFEIEKLSNSEVGFYLFGPPTVYFNKTGLCRGVLTAPSSDYYFFGPMDRPLDGIAKSVIYNIRLD